MEQNQLPDFCSECGAYWDCDCGEYSRKEESLRYMKEVYDWETYKFHFPNTNDPDATLNKQIDQVARDVADATGQAFEYIRNAILTLIEPVHDITKTLEQLKQAAIQLKKELLDIQNKQKPCIIPDWIGIDWGGQESSCFVITRNGKIHQTIRSPP